MASPHTWMVRIRSLSSETIARQISELSPATIMATTTITLYLLACDALTTVTVVLFGMRGHDGRSNFDRTTTSNPRQKISCCQHNHILRCHQHDDSFTVFSARLYCPTPIAPVSPPSLLVNSRSRWCRGRYRRAPAFVPLLLALLLALASLI
jgi:hypothetical protein